MIIIFSRDPRFVGCFWTDGEKQGAKSNPKRPSVAPTAAVPPALPRTEKPKKNTKNDDFTEYVNQPMAGHKWNEHEYYVKAKNDMRKHHHDKVAKVFLRLDIINILNYKLLNE